MEVSPGVTLERRWSPLRSVGIYVPKGLVSSLIMTAVPAQVAGVERIVVCTPPSGSAAVAADRGAARASRRSGRSAARRRSPRWPTGRSRSLPSTRSSVPAAVRSTRPSFWSAATSPSTLPAGPSEIVVVADDGVDEALIAQEIAAQMEHGPDSQGLRRPRGRRPRSRLGEIERLRRRTRGPVGRTRRVPGRSYRNAGAVFVGPYSPVPAGDYATGGNHVLPTGGWARSTGGLGLEGFMKTVTVQRVTKEGLERLAPTIEALAELEGMDAHRATARR